MADLSTLARPYAKAAFDYAKEHHAINEWQEYLAVMNTIVNDKAFAEYLQNPAIAATTKVSTLTDLYNQIAPEDSNNVFKTLSSAIEGGQKADASAFVNYLTQLAEQERLALLPHIHERFDLLKSADAKQVHAYLTSAYPLTKAQELLLQTRLATSLNAEIILHVEVDPSLIGGVIIKVGDKVIDDSVRGKLKQLKTQLIS